MKKNTLIIQFQTNGRVEDLDRLQKLELALEGALYRNRSGVVDGNDFGPGTMNIFIFPKRGWDSCIEVVLAYLDYYKELHNALVIKRFKNETYEVVWPKDFSGDFERC